MGVCPQCLHGSIINKFGAPEPFELKQGSDALVLGKLGFKVRPHLLCGCVSGRSADLESFEFRLDSDSDGTGDETKSFLLTLSNFV